MTSHSSTACILPDARKQFAEETGAMQMAIKTHRWTRQDLERLPDDGNKYEVVRGELFVSPAPAASHQDIVMVITRYLAPYVAGQQLGDIHFPRSVVVIGDSEVEPDLMVRPRVPPPPPAWEDRPVPFLVVEVLSDTTRRRDLIAKRSLYMDAGVAEYWMVDGDRRTITVARADVPDLVTTDVLQWHPAGATVALDLDVSAVFREALG